jgi:hypothetical protein
MLTVLQLADCRPLFRRQPVMLYFHAWESSMSFDFFPPLLPKLVLWAYISGLQIRKYVVRSNLFWLLLAEQEVAANKELLQCVLVAVRES